MTRDRDPVADSILACIEDGVVEITMRQCPGISEAVAKLKAAGAHKSEVVALLTDATRTAPLARQCVLMTVDYLWRETP